jgi:replicative DNA helicase
MKPNSNYRLGQLPPQAIEIEEAVIAACMLEAETYEIAAEIIHTEDMFYKEEYRLIWQAMGQLRQIGRAIDLLTITEQLKQMAKLEIVGGAYELTKLTMAVSNTAHTQVHALIVAEKYNARELIRICSEAIGKAFAGEEDVFELLTATEKNIQCISEGTSQSEFIPVGDTYLDVLMDIEEAKYKPSGITGIHTGYNELNGITDGWQPSNLVLLAARPSQGKTALALNFAINANCGVLIYSLEANKKELVKRFAAMKTGVWFSAVKKGQLTTLQEQMMQQHIQFFQSCDIKIDDKTQNLNKILHGIRREKKRNPNMKMVVIDYIQLIRGAKDKNGNREQEVSTISRELKLIASELEITVMALSQLNREVEKTANKRPSLSNLRESGALEQDANIVLMIWHEQVDETNNKSYVLIEKNRDGELGDIELKFSGDIQKWIEIDNTPTGRPDNPRAGFQSPRMPYVEDEPF